MSKKIGVAILLSLLLALVFILVAEAQDPAQFPAAVPQEDAAAQTEASRGAIRGTVYRDANNDAVCGGEGEGPLAGIPIRFSSSGDTEVFLQSGPDGTFGLVAAGLGHWEVAPVPSAEQGVVTSASPLGVTITAEEPTAEGVNFCIGTARASQGVLPVSGAPSAPAFWLVVLLGVLLLAAGAGLHFRRA